MRAARLHKVATPFQIDEMDIPEPKGSDVLVRVRACGVVPNLRNVVYHYPEWFPDLPLPALPAIYGLDPVGEVAAIGPNASGLEIGQRVYVNPLRYCGTCDHCRSGAGLLCANQTMAGYFGMGPKSHEIYARYPWGGFAEYMIAPADSMVVLSDKVSFEAGARFGYLGTSYSALCNAKAGVRTTVLVNGGTGTLGVGTVMLALAMGVPKIIAVARNSDLLDRVKALAPDRIEIMNAKEGNLPERVRAATDGQGVDIVVDCLSAHSGSDPTMDGLMSLRRGGRLVFIGGMDHILPMTPIYLMVQQISFIGSCWFTTSQAQDMASMVESGVLDLSALQHKVYELEQLNEALLAAENRTLGGFENIVVRP